MKYLEAKALVHELENKADERDIEDKWHLKVDPEAYLARSPDGPNAELARRILEAEES